MLFWSYVFLASVLDLFVFSLKTPKSHLLIAVFLNVVISLFFVWFDTMNELKSAPLESKNEAYRTWIQEKSSSDRTPQQVYFMVVLAMRLLGYVAVGISNPFIVMVFWTIFGS